jgi:hypothetical protein
MDERPVMVRGVSLQETEYGMKRGRSLVMALAVMVLAPLPLLAQGGGQGAGRGMGGAMSARLLLDQGSVEYLVTKATDLTLDADQTKKLTDLGAAWAASTKDSRETIRKEMPQPGQGMGDREAMMQKMQALQPVMQKLAEDDQKSLDEAMKVLSAEQQTKAKTLLEERRQNARPRRPGGNG